jgi:hypothetical protein
MLEEQGVTGQIEEGQMRSVLAGLVVLTIATGWQIGVAHAQSSDGVEGTKPLSRTAAPRKMKRAAAAARGGYYIEFRSRLAVSYGHTFTMFGRLNSRGEIATQEVAGLHPKGETGELWTLGHVVPVPAETGPSDGDLQEEFVSARYRIDLNKEEYDRIVAHIRHKQANSPVWHATLYNCNLWTGEIAHFMGLQTPFHWLPPQEYVNTLREMNGPNPTLSRLEADATSSTR